MKKQLTIILILLLSGINISAQENQKPFQLALINPVQIVAQDLSVHGFRFNFLYGENENVVGFDMGLVNQTNGYQTGAQLGVVSTNKGDFEGFRMNVVNIGEGKMDGCALAVVNVQHGKQLKGAMIGVVNVTNPPVEEQDDRRKIKRKGTQIGLVNVTESLRGVQIGLININKSARIKFCPFILISKKVS